MKGGISDRDVERQALTGSQSSVSSQKDLMSSEEKWKREDASFSKQEDACRSFRRRTDKSCLVYAAIGALAIAVIALTALAVTGFFWLGGEQHQLDDIQRYIPIQVFRRVIIFLTAVSLH